MTSDPETLAVYDAKAADYAALTESEARDKQLTAFIADMPPGGTVLDLGCGPGQSAAVMAAHGLRVTINSDDPAYFGGYVGENFLQTQQALDLDADDIRTLAINSFTASFLINKPC